MAVLRVTGGLMALAVLGLAGCAPSPAPIAVEDAQVLCAQLALDRGNQNRVRVGVGLGTGRISGGHGAIGISTDSLIPVANRNHEAAYRDCVVKRSGQLPQKTFYQQLGARG